VTDNRPEIAAEQIVLGSMMLDASMVEKLTAIVGETDFDRPPHRAIYRAIVELHSTAAPTEAAAVTAAMAESAELVRVGGAPYLYTVVESVPTTASAPYYARLVRAAAEARHLDLLAIKLGDAAGATEPEKRHAIVAEVREQLDALAGTAEEAESRLLAAVPGWPTASVPGPIGDLVRASGGLPDALVGGAGLGAVATVVPGAELYIHDTWTERPNVWIPLMAPPGAGKSPAMSTALGAVDELDAAAHRLYRDRLQMWRETPPKERDERPVNPTRLVRDTTLEQLARRLDGARTASGISSATFAPDELQNFLGALGQYKRGTADRARMLELWAGRPWQYERVGGDVDILIPYPVVPIVGGIQPELHDLLGGEGDGLRPRWLLHLATLDPVAQEAGGMATVPPAWSVLLNTLYGKITTPRVWKLTGPARRTWQESCRRWKAAAADGETASTSAALVKADIQAARVALIIAESMEPAAGGDLPPEAMVAAISVVDFALDCWRALPERGTLGLSRRADALDAAVDKLLAWLESHGGAASRGDLLRAHVAGVRVAGDLDALLDRYRETYPGTVATERTGQRGRPAVVVRAPRRRLGGTP
jgi:DnaB helicase-like protein/uncharacterized protein DUF3987